jgi:hypothetical protein
MKFSLKYSFQLLQTRMGVFSIREPVDSRQKWRLTNTSNLWIPWRKSSEQSRCLVDSLGLRKIYTRFSDLGNKPG